jgi:hypothetical protein
MSQKTKPPARPWPVTLGGLLIMAQGLLLLFLSISSLIVVVSIELGATIVPLQSLFPASFQLVNLELVLWLGATLGLALALLFILNSLRFWQKKPRAWLTAMILQGLNLGLALALYFNGQRGLVFVMMAYGILMVLHLNRADVTTAFHVRPASELENLDDREL